MAGRPARLQVDIVADARGVAKGTKEAEDRFSALGGVAGKAGKAAALGVAAVGVAAAGMAVASVKAASDLEQSMGAVETVFGKSASAVKKYAESSATRLGLAKADYSQLAAAVGTSMGNMGKSQAESAKLTDQLIGRAADLAATFGGTTMEATSALGAAFRGEFDSVERLGIALKASDISAELAARGQAKLTGQALKNAQGQATLDLIMRQTTKSAGAFSRESDTLAHQQQVLGAQFDNVKAAVGARLIPALVRAAQWFQNRVLPAAQQLDTQLRARLGPALTQVGAWVNTRLLPALRSLTGFVLTKIVPGFQGYLMPILAGIRSAFSSVAGAVGRNSGQFAKLKPLVTAAAAVFRTLYPIVGTVMGRALRILGGALGLVVDILGGLIGMVDAVIRKFDDLARKAGEIVGTVRDKVGTIGDVIGKIPGLSLEVTPMVPGGLSGPVGGLGPGLGVLATAAAADPLAYSLGGGAGRSRLTASGRTVNMPITINGALDPVAVARQLESVLRAASIRLGRAPAYGW